MALTVPVTILVILWGISYGLHLCSKGLSIKLHNYSKVNLFWNVFIRYFHEVSINIFVIALLNIRFYDYSILPIGYFISYLLSIAFVLFSFTYLYKLRRYFKKHPDSEEWNPGFFEIYNGLNLKSSRVLDFLYIFFGKRLIFSFAICIYGLLDPNVQNSILLVTFTSTFIYTIFINLFDNWAGYLTNI